MTLQITNPRHPDTEAFLELAYRIGSNAFSLGRRMVQIMRGDGHPGMSHRMPIEPPEPEWSRLDADLRAIADHSLLRDPAFPYRAVIEHLKGVGKMFKAALAFVRRAREHALDGRTICESGPNFCSAGWDLMEVIKKIPPPDDAEHLAWAEEDLPIGPPQATSMPATGQQVSGVAPVQPPGPLNPPLPESPLREPTSYLLSWREILECLGMSNRPEGRRRVRDLNERQEGPIIMPGPGGQPKVERSKLVAWWNQLEQTFHEREQKQADRRASASEQYRAGRRGGTVLPELDGSVKKRRQPKRPETE